MAEQQEIDRDELETRFTYHPPQVGHLGRYAAIRVGALAFAKLIVDTTPESREQALALTALEEAMLWANSAIVRRS